MPITRQSKCFFLPFCRGWSGGAMVLGKLPVPGTSYNFDYSRARAYCARSRCGWGCLDIFTLIYLFSPFSPSLWETARYRLKYCLKGPLNPKQPTNQLPFCRFSLTNVLTYSLTSFHFRPKIFHIVSVCIGSLCSANGSVSISTGCSIALPYTSLRGLIPILS